MKVIHFLLLFSILVLLIPGCGEDIKRENPLDSQNEYTGGVPPGLTARAGDSEVVLSWPNTGIDGIKEYKIYRAHLAPTPGQFKHAGSVQAEPKSEVPEYVFTDTGLQNDGDNVYFYRLTYVDNQGNETPDPINPQNLAEDWFLVELIPSIAPPVPEVRVIEDTDLQVRLVWEDYSAVAPEDLAGFRIYCVLKTEEGLEQEPCALIAEIDDPGAEFYIDGNDYDNDIINFFEDGVTKLYRVVAFDKYGVESDSPVLEGTSPNLPPGEPEGVKTDFEFDWDSYKAIITWKPCPEPDVEGYAIYAVSDGQVEFKRMIKGRNQNKAVVSERLDIFLFSPGDFYVVAFDNTCRDDGKRDESTERPPGPVLPGTEGKWEIGDAAPDFTLPKLDGGMVSLKELRGRVVVLDFFATWCGPCVMEIPHLQGFYEKYQDRGLVMLGIDLAEPEADVRAFRDQNGLTYDILLDEAGTVGTLYEVMFIPTLWIIDREGIIFWKNVGFSPGAEAEIEQQILSIL